MPAKHAARPTAIQAHHGIWRDRSADRHRWSSLDYGFCCRFTKTNESLVDSRNQGAELIGPDLITSQIGADDLHGEFSVGRCGRRFVGHFCVPPLRPTAYHTRSIPGGDLGSPYPSRRSSTILSVPAASRQDPTGLSLENSSWEVERKMDDLFSKSRVGTTTDARGRSGASDTKAGCADLLKNLRLG